MATSTDLFTEIGDLKREYTKQSEMVTEVIAMNKALDIEMKKEEEEHQKLLIRLEEAKNLRKTLETVKLETRTQLNQVEKWEKKLEKDIQNLSKTLSTSTDSCNHIRQKIKDVVEQIKQEECSLKARLDSYFASMVEKEKRTEREKQVDEKRKDLSSTNAQILLLEKKCQIVVSKLQTSIQEAKEEEKFLQISLAERLE